MWHSKLNKCDSGVVGNARPCQGRDRGFEPRLSLLFNKKRTSGKDVLFSLKEPHPGLKVRASSFHCGRRRAGVHRTPCAVYRFCSTKKGHPERMSFFVERAPSGAQSSSVSVPLRSAQSRCPPDTLRRLSLLFNKKRTSGKDVLFRRKSPIRGSKFERLRSTAVGAEQVSTGHLAPSIASVQQKMKDKITG